MKNKNGTHGNGKGHQRKKEAKAIVKKTTTTPAIRTTKKKKAQKVNDNTKVKNPKTKEHGTNR